MIIVSIRAYCMLYLVSICVAYPGKLLGKLGRVQLELKELLDIYVSFDLMDAYELFALRSFTMMLFHICADSKLVPQRSHIFQTITNPAEILLSELRTVEVCFLFIICLNPEWLGYGCM